MYPNSPQNDQNRSPGMPAGQTGYTPPPPPPQQTPSVPSWSVPGAQTPPSQPFTTQPQGQSVPSSLPPQFSQPVPVSQTPPPQTPLQPLGPIPGAMPIKALPSRHGPFALLFSDWMKMHWKRVVLIVLGVILLGLVIFQIVYPNSRMLPGATVDGINVGGMTKTSAAAKLNELYGTQKIHIFFGKATAAFLSPEIKDVGINVVNEDRLNNMQYPFYLRFIPTSIFWVNSLIKPGNLSYTYDKDKIQSYTQGEVGDSCTIPAKDATLKLIDSQLQVVSSVAGGTCDISQFQQALAEATPTAGDDNDIRIDSTETPAAVDNDKARTLADKLNNRLKNPMPISLGSDTQDVPGRIVLGWLDFKSNVPEENIDNSANQSAQLVYSINSDRISTYLSQGIAAKVVVKPGTTKIATTDFTVTSRTDGKGGRELDTAGTSASVTNYIESKSDHATATTKDVGPTMVYTRTYTATQTGLSALVTQYAQDNAGTYGISVQEISGVKNLRSASYNGDVRMKSAGIESLYIGYAVVSDNYENLLLPNQDISSGRNVQTCLKAMIIKSDDDCRKGFYNAMGYNHTTARGQELGLTNTVFAAQNGVTSANDLTKVLAGIYSNTIGRTQGANQILTMSRTTEADDGLPADLKSGTSVSHFIGESSDGTVYNDAGVIYGSNGAYAVSILSKDSSWDKIAAFAKKLETFKAMKVSTK